MTIILHFRMKNPKVETLKYLPLILLVFAACKDQNGRNNNAISDIFTKDVFNSEAVSQILKQNVAQPKTFWPYTDSSDRVDLSELYAANKYQPLWFNDKAVNTCADSLLKAITSLPTHGISVDAFKVEDLQASVSDAKKGKITSDTAASRFELALSAACAKLCNAITHGTHNKDSLTKEWYNTSDTTSVDAKTILSLIATDSVQELPNILAPKLPEYNAARTALTKLESIREAGGWQKISNLKDSIKLGASNPAIAVLRKRLNIELGLPKDTLSQSIDADLILAITRFQYMHDIKQTGILDTTTLRKLNITVSEKIATIKTNLERMRWLQRDYKQPYIFVNIPRMELLYINNDSNQFKMRVVVGRTSRPTPSLDAPITNIVFNPPWNVPPTIMKEEIVPGIARKGGNYLARRGLKAFLGGRAVDPKLINANNFKKFTISQKPGLNASLGVVKFNMPNRHAIYLHDTPHREDFVKNYRAFSSGCVRVHKPREFAEFLLQDTLYTKVKIDSMARTKTTKDVKLKEKLDVHIVYLTNGVDSAGNIMYWRDIYAQDAKFVGVWK
jgi:L,D-transpeptidase YcbB